MANGKKIVELAQKVLPSPFSIAILLTIFTLFLALVFTTNSTPETSYSIKLLGYWQNGLWDLLKFGMQMVLMLLLGHVLALSKPTQRIISFFTQFVKNTSTAAIITAFLTLVMSFFNWGLGLIFGAIFARKVADYCMDKNIKINYPLVGAAGYSGLMVWHGGISGSAPLLVADKGHFLESKIGIIGLEKTVLSPMNITASILIIIGVCSLVYLIGRKASYTEIEVSSKNEFTQQHQPKGAEKLDYSNLSGITAGSIILILALKTAITSNIGLKFINPNYINFLLFGICLIAHQNFNSFLNATEEAVGGSTGIIVQFPLYAGIMGIMKSSGLVDVFSDIFVQVSSSSTFPIFTFFSAGLVNIFVPSGGGQWAVQGPIIAEACSKLNVPIEKGVMALAYGDQLTNMLQPFWALPLLGITKLKAHQILPYSFLIMLVGIAVFCFCLIFF